MQFRLNIKHLLSLVAGGALVCSTALRAQDPPVGVSELLFEDTFEVSGASFDVNFEIDGARQSGRFAGTPWLELATTGSGGAADDLTGVGDPEFPGKLTAIATQSILTPLTIDHNFTEAATFTIEFDVDPGVNVPARDSGDWAHLVLGANQRTVWVNGSDGFGILFRNNRAYQVFDGGTPILGSETGVLPEGEFHVRVEVTGVDYRGGGDATVQVFVNDEALMLTGDSDTFVRTGGFTANYITLGGLGGGGGVDLVHVFDNLRITGLTCILADAEVIAEEGTSDVELTVTVPAPALDGGPVAVTISSDDPSIAEPAGATDGSLTVTFAQGGPATQTVAVNAVTPGSTSFSMSNDAGICVGDAVNVVVTETPTEVFVDDFERVEIGNQWRVNEAPFETGAGESFVGIFGGVLELDVNLTDNFWGGISIVTERTFSASLTQPLIFEVDRAYDDGFGTATRSGVWITDQTRGQYILFSHNVGEGGWQYNRFIGAPGDNPTGAGTNVDAFDFLDEDFDSHRIRLVANGETVKIYLDDIFGAEVAFPVTENIVFELATYARASGDTIIAGFDNVSILSAGETGLPCISANPPSASLFAGATGELTVAVPGLFVLDNEVNVTVTSSDPDVVTFDGADEAGVLVLNFPAGGAAAQTFTMQAGRRGLATISLTNDQDLCVLGDVNINVFASFVRDPSFENTPRPGGVGYGAIADWTGGSGINNGPPFGDNGDIPDRGQIGFSQGSTSLGQEILGLEPGEEYWIQFRYNRRNCCGTSSIGLSVLFDGAELAVVEEIPAVGDGPYHFINVPFVPGNDRGMLQIVSAATGDATLLVDAVTIVKRDASHVVLQNPSFEASGVVGFPGYIQPQFMSGWQATGNYGVNVSGAGPFANNGLNTDQDNVGFLQGDASISQEIDKFVVGTEYELSFVYNARSGNTPQLRVTIGDTVLLDEAVSPVGGTEPYHAATFTFTAESAKATLTFAQTAAGDNTVLIDDVKLIGESANIECIVVQPRQLALTEGQVGPLLTLEASEGLLAIGDAVVEVRSTNPDVVVPVGADAEGVLVVTFEAAGELTRTIDLMATGRGNAVIELSSASTVVCFSDESIDVAVTSTFIKNPGFEASPPAVFPTYGSIANWDGTSNFGVNNSSGPFFDNGILPDGRQVGFVQVDNSLGQIIGGLDPEKNYWLQFWYNTRNCCPGGAEGPLDFQVTYGDQILFEGFEVTSVSDAAGGEPFLFAASSFVPASNSGRFEIAILEGAGDRSLVFDAFTIVQRDEDDILVRNPSFETSSPVPAPGYLGMVGAEEQFNLAGWEAAGNYGVNVSGAGPFANNGVNPDQDAVVFLQNIDSSIAQTIEGLTPGEPYTLSYAFNARAGNTPNLRVTIAGQTVQDSPVFPVGGANAYHENRVTFTPDTDLADLVFEQTAEGDQTVLIDNIRIQPGTTDFVPCIAVQPTSATMNVGQVGSPVTVLVAPQAVADGDVQVTVTSDTPGVAVPAGADGEGVLTLTFTSDGPLQQSFDIAAVGSGSAMLTLANDSGICFVQNTIAVTAVRSFLANAGFEDSPRPGGVGYGAIAGWGGGSGINTSSGPFADNGLIPDRSQVAFLQGSNALSQRVNGLEPDESYWVQFWYNVRNCCGGTINLSVSFDGAELAVIEDIQPVGAEMPYHNATILFTPESASGDLVFTTTAMGDATALLDAVNIVPRGPDDVIVLNPSFETSGAPPFPGYIQPATIAGWIPDVEGGYGVNLSGPGPFANNGTNPDQDHVLFMQGPGTQSQVIHGLEIGREYTLTFGYNARVGGTPQLRVSIDDVVLLDEVVSPVTGTNPYHAGEFLFTATGESMTLTLEKVATDGDTTGLFDDIRIIAGEGGLPRLSAEVTVDGLRISWPLSAEGFVLQRINELGDAWTDAGLPVVEGDNDFSVVVPLDGISGYFRLFNAVNGQ